VMMNRVQAAISAVMQYAVARKRYGLEANPVRGMQRLYQEAPRERNLDAHEIATIWRDLEGRTPVNRAVLRLILLTGQRSGEIRRMRWADIEGSTWTMPPGYRKRKGKASRRHRVHLSQLSIAELERVRAYERDGFVFPNRSHKPIDKDGLARVVGRMCSRLVMERWTPHDLRRTARTMWTDLGVDWVVGEKLLGHRLPGILATYDRGEQWEDRVAALDRWGRHLTELTHL
jgi:integrase